MNTKQPPTTQASQAAAIILQKAQALTTNQTIYLSFQSEHPSFECFNFQTHDNLKSNNHLRQFFITSAYLQQLHPSAYDRLAANIVNALTTTPHDTMSSIKTTQDDSHNPQKDETENLGPSRYHIALPHDLFVWCVQQGMPEVECQTAQKQMKWIQSHVRRLQNKVDEAEYIKRQLCDVVPMLTSKSWEDIWERCRDAFRPQ